MFKNRVSPQSDFWRVTGIGFVCDILDYVSVVELVL